MDSSLVCPTTIPGYDLEFGVGPHEALHLVEDLIDMGDVPGDGGKAEKGASSKILVVQLRCRDAVAAARGVE